MIILEVISLSFQTAIKFFSFSRRTQKTGYIISRTAKKMVAKYSLYAIINGRSRILTAPKVKNSVQQGLIPSTYLWLSEDGF
jgi:hypothetical protein